MNEYIRWLGCEGGPDLLAVFKVLNPGTGKINIWFFQCANSFFKIGGLYAVICIDEGKVFAPGLKGAIISGFSDPFVFLSQYPDIFNAGYGFEFFERQPVRAL